MALLQIMGLLQLEDANGLPRSGAKAYTYQTGTTTPLTTYSDSGLTTPHANPVVADSEGVWPPVYVPTTTDVKVTFKTSADVTLRTVDPVPVTAAVAALSVDTAQLVNNSVTNAKLADMATATIKGRNTAATGDPEDLSPATVAAMLGSFRKVSSTTLTGLSAADFVLTPTTDRAYLFIYDAVVVTSDGADFWSRVSVDGGVSFLTTATYNHTRVAADTTPAVAGVGSLGVVAAIIGAALDSTTSQNLSGIGFLIVGGAAAHATKLLSLSGYLNSGGTGSFVGSNGSNSTASQVNAIRFMPSTSTFASGTIHCYALSRGP